MTTTPELMALLRRHYIKPGAPLPGGVFLEEVGWNGGTGNGRVDALYIGLTGSSGRQLVGHELKVSRADWLAELRKPGKADEWADQCHAWWLVTVPGVVLDGELPDGWGLMYPGTSRTRMKIVVKPEVHRDRTPSWDAMRSIVGRQDSLRAQGLAAERRDRDVKVRDLVEQGITERIEQRMKYQPDAAEQLALLRRYQTALGPLITPDEDVYAYRGIDEERLLDLAALIAGSGDLHRAAGQLASRYAAVNTAAMRRAIADLEAEHAAIVDKVAQARLDRTLTPAQEG